MRITNFRARSSVRLASSGVSTAISAKTLRSGLDSRSHGSALRPGACRPHAGIVRLARSDMRSGPGVFPRRSRGHAFAADPGDQWTGRERTVLELIFGEDHGREDSCILEADFPGQLTDGRERSGLGVWQTTQTSKSESQVAEPRAREPNAHTRAPGTSMRMRPLKSCRT